MNCSGMGTKLNMKKKIWIIIIIIIVLAAAGGGIWWYLSSKSTDSQSVESLVAGKGQEVITGTINSIIGNEMTISLSAQGETREFTIPVGTEVITRLGTSTTFSRLASGDVIEILLEEGTDNIIKIHITQ